MFGSSTNTPFGTGTSFGTGTTFGSQNTTTQFGANSGIGTSLFGNKAQTGFGTFNQPQSSGTSGLFGSTTTNTAGSLFGGTGTGSIFGQQPTTQSSFGFGSTGTGLFGSAAKSSTGTSVFQTPGSTSAFGTGTSTAFGTTTGSSLFGANTNKSTGLFGTGLLGASATADKGTPVKFSVVQGNDSMVKNGITTNISVRHQCITVMSTYDKKSIEELRIEDYEAGRKTGASGATGFTGLPTSTSTGGLFGTSGTGFGASSSLIGQKPATGFGPTGSLFGSSAGTSSLFGQQQTTAPAFGQKPGGLFGTPTSSTTGTGFSAGFGTTSLFGQSTSGQTAGLFGATTTSAGSSLFGGQNTGFGQTQTGTGGLFGQTGFGLGQQQIVTEVSDPTVVSKEEVDDYFTHKLIPYVTCQYEKSTKVHATLTQLIADLISAVERTNGKAKVCKWLKPFVKVRDSTLGAAIYILKSALADILAKAGTPYTATNFSQVCREVNGASADFRTDFGNGHRELSIKIPRQALNEDQLKTIDGWFGIQQSNDEAAEGVSEDARDVDRCSNCVTLNKEILAKHRQWAEQEQAIKAAHEKEVAMLHKQLKQERDKCDKLEKELLLARRTIEYTWPKFGH